MEPGGQEEGGELVWKLHRGTRKDARLHLPALQCLLWKGLLGILHQGQEVEGCPENPKIPREGCGGFRSGAWTRG